MATKETKDKGWEPHGQQWQLVSIDNTVKITTVRLPVPGGWLYSIEFKSGMKTTTFVPMSSVGPGTVETGPRK